MPKRKNGVSRDRPKLPKGYIKTTPRGLLSWDDAERILRGGRYYWIATTSPGGAPHLVQQWGAWVDGSFWFEGSEKTRWARNLVRDPRVGFGTQIAHEAAMCEGVVEIVRGAERALATAIAKQYAGKYGRTFSYRPTPEQYEKGAVFRARATKVIVFDVKRFNTSATRFTFAAP